MIAPISVGMPSRGSTFVAGIAIQFGFGEADRHSIEFAEDWGQLFNWFVFFLLGTVAAGTLALQKCGG